jgi:hypothetical protein
MSENLLDLSKKVCKNFCELFPILAVVIVFRWVVVGEPMPDVWQRWGVILLALLGLTLLVRRLDLRILPFRQGLWGGVVGRRGMFVLVVVGFAAGFVSTLAQPALAAVADQAAAAAIAADRLAGGEADMARFALVLRYLVSAAVGLAVATGVFRIVKGWPAAWFVLPGYALATVIALSSESPLATVAFDSAATATSAVNIPLMMTVGTALAALIEARDPLTDGFGLIAAATLMPMIVIQLAAVALGG